MFRRLLWLLLSALWVVAAPAAMAAPRSLTLQEAVALALQVDPVLASAKTGEERARLAILRAQLDRVSVKLDGQLQELWNKTNIGGPTQYLCTVSGLAFTTTSRAACESSGGQASALDDQAAQGLFNLTASVNAPLFTGFRVTSNVRRSQRLDEAAAANIKQVRKDVAIAVARLYWSVRRLGLLIDVQKQALARMMEAERVVGGRVQAGLAPPVDSNRAQLRRLQQLATVADYVGQEREAAAQLAVNLGVSDDLELVDAPIIPAQGPLAVADLLRSAEKGRPEIAAARWQWEAQKQSVKMAQSSYYPQLSVFGLFQYGNNPYVTSVGARDASIAANPFANLSGNLTLGAQLNMNFFDMLNTYTAVKDAKFEEARLAAERRRWDRVVEGDVRQIHARIERLYARRAPLGEACKVAQDNVTILQGRYRNGDALVIELLDAEIELTNAELQLADLNAQLRLAWIELDAALGSVVGMN